MGSMTYRTLTLLDRLVWVALALQVGLDVGNNMALFGTKLLVMAGQA